MLPIHIIAPWCHSTWPCSTRPDIYPNNKSIIIILKWHPLSLVTFPHKSFLRREFDSLSICLHTKVRSHLQIEIKKSSVYSASIHSSIFFPNYPQTFVIFSCSAVGIRLVCIFSSPFILHFYCQINLILFLPHSQNVTRRKKPLSVCHIMSQCISELNVYVFESSTIKQKWAIISVCMCVLVSNIAGRLSSTDTGSLLPTLSYLYCFLSLSSAHGTDRGKRLVPIFIVNIASSLTLRGLLHQEQAGIH